ncbi:MXAN_5187 family protein [Hyalangium sp.]|uniref:MXAN_5187 family protein n=1 Tax=Hyalangium sp. TaxID=2028555 RepID=UPI002D6D8784|nr:MXAN_5187 family protein [Hyalangium sp.]HYH97383.1 MXAN_5187 family protein [Hyalangium sp.]
MVRVKFLIFALLALGLGLAHLAVLSGPMRTRATEDAQAQASAGTAEVVRNLEARRGIARALALKLAASSELASAAQDLSTPEAPTAERFAPVRAAAEAALPKDLPGVVLGVVTPGGAMHVRAGGEPSADAAVLDVKALAQADAPSVVEAFGIPHAFAAVPLVWRFVRIPGAEKLETQLAATLVVGVPLLPEGALEDAARASGAAALGLVKEDVLVAGGGGEKVHLEKALSTLKEGQPASVVHSGQVHALGPLKLPLLTSSKDFLGGQAPLVVGSRRALEGTAYQVLSLANTKLMVTLADYQRNAIFGLGALLVVSLLWTVLMGSGKSAREVASESGGDTLGLGSAMAAMHAQQAPRPAAVPPPATHPGLEMTAASPVAAAARPPTGEFPFGPPPSVHDAPAAQGAPPLPSAPFAFPPAPEPQPQPYEAQPYGSQPQGFAPTPFESGHQMPPQAGAELGAAMPRAGAFHFEELPTAAYSLQQAADPYAAAAAMDDSPETTRVAAIPRELLQAAARPSTQEMPLPAQFAAAPPPSAPSVAPVPWNEPGAQAVPLPGAAYQQYLGNTGDAFSEEDFHFQEVFREFVLTRERCSEPSDGLTYDKFVQKLRKNKEQLVQKYACRTVKFQVYVKEGKAALKATPVKD